VPVLIPGKGPSVLATCLESAAPPLLTTYIEAAMRHHFSRPTVVGLLLVLASCGGSDDAASPSVSSATGDAVVASSDSVAAAAADAPDDAPAVTSGSEAPDSRAAPGTGLIQIGDIRHELTVSFCASFADAVTGRAVSVSEPDNFNVNFNFSPEDWRDRSSEGWTDPGNVRVDIVDREQQWESGARAFEGYALSDGVDPASFQITAVDITDDGQSASGQATFVDLNALLADGNSTATPGSFEFTCPAN
jgi:hypothetical protein